MAKLTIDDENLFPLMEQLGYKKRPSGRWVHKIVGVERSGYFQIAYYKCPFCGHEQNEMTCYCPDCGSELSDDSTEV